MLENETRPGMLALELMTEALLVLDETALPADVGAHLDLAIHRLRQHLDQGRTMALRAASASG